MQHSNSLLPFDYRIVDGFGRARQRGIEPMLHGKRFFADELGPIIEFTNLSDCGSLSELRSSTWFEENSLKPLFDALTAKRTRWLGCNGRLGLALGRGLNDENEVTSFKIDAHKAARRFSSSETSSLLVAAMGELIGNVTDHSEAEHTGIAVFAAGARTFEFVVADAGIGILRSLTKNINYAYLQDEGAALAATVEAGVSRFDQNTGHGNGFRPIFERLADMTGRLRFRSGCYALSLDGRFGDRISRQIAQKPWISGFFTAVTCHISGSFETRFVS